MRRSLSGQRTERDSTLMRETKLVSLHQPLTRLKGGQSPQGFVVRILSNRSNNIKDSTFRQSLLYWLGVRDSNPRMLVPKTSVLPLDEPPSTDTNQRSAKTLPDADCNRLGKFLREDRWLCILGSDKGFVLDRVKAYYYMTKPGIIQGNLLMVAAGYLLASHFNIRYLSLPGVLVGTTFMIAASCVVNNYIDRDIDRKMERTKKRALVKGNISATNALSFAAVLMGLGILALSLYTNALTLIVGYLGVFFYVVMYSIFKRKSVHGTLIGSVSGAIPPVAGYVAFSNHLDLGALLLFLIMVAWQMTHFYAIAVYRHADYKAAGIPVLPVVEGMRETKEQMLIYSILFIVATSLLTYYEYTGYTYLVVTVLLGLWWLNACVQGFSAKDDIKWGKSIFKKSLIILLVLSIMISLGPILP